MDHNIEPIKVLFIHHVGLIGGSSRSLFELINAFPKNSISPHIICPTGKLSQALAEKGVSHISCVGVPKFDNCAYSYYRGFRWLILIRELAFVFPFFHSCLTAKKTWKRFDIIHINDIPLLPAAWIAHKIFPQSKVVLHARAVQVSSSNLRTRLFYKVLSSFVDKVIAISLHVFNSLLVKTNALVIHNGLKPPNNIKTKSASPMTVGMVGMISKSKGCDSFIEAARICKNWGLDIRFLLIGETNSKNGFISKILKTFGLEEDTSGNLKKRVQDLGLDDSVLFLPFNADLNAVYSQLDVLCFPSLLDAPGRPIFEAAFFNIPSIASISEPQPDTFVDGVTGFAIAPNNPQELAEKIKLLNNDPALRHKLGQAARLLAEQNFDSEKNALKVLENYKLILN